MVRRDLSKREKLLLQLMGRHPYLTNEELSSIIGFKYAEYVSTLQKKLEKREYLMGPVMFPDFGKIFKNKVDRAFAFIMFDQSYNYMRALLQEITCWTFFYPLEEGIFRKYMVGFMSSDICKLKDILDYLKNEGALHYYHLFELEGNWKEINPTFLIDEKEAPAEPDFNTLLDEIEVPDLKWGSFAGITLSKVARILMMYLWNGHGKCDLRKIVRLEKKYRVKRRKELRAMLREEKWEVKRKELKAELRELSGDLPLKKFREAYQMLMDHNVLEKHYYILPFPQSRCSRFMLFLKCDSIEDTKRAIFNFGTNVRIFTRVCMVQSADTGEWYGVIFAVGDSFLGGKLMTALDQNSEIVDRKLFPMRSYPSSQWASQSISLGRYYDPETQTLNLPYKTYYERVKQRLEKQKGEQISQVRGG